MSEEILAKHFQILTRETSNYTYRKHYHLKAGKIKGKNT